MPAAVRPEDVAFNRVSVALARSQSLVASWLPPRPAEDAAAQKTSEQLQQEESALFTPGSDILGVGAEPPKDIADGSFKRNQLSSNDRLRQQLLGRHAAKTRNAQSVDRNSVAASHLPTKKLERPAKPSRVQEDSDDEEDGRAAMFKSKRKAAPPPTKKEESADDSESESDVKGKAGTKREAPAPPAAQEKSRKRPVSFLDEILEERSKKKNRKQKAALDQAKPAARAEPEESPEKKSQAVPAAMKDQSRGDDDGSDDSEGKENKAASKFTSTKGTVRDGEAGKAATPVDSALFDRSDKKKKKKRKKKRSKGEATAEP